MHIAYDQLFIKNKILQLIRINDETPVKFLFKFFMIGF